MLGAFAQMHNFVLVVFAQFVLDVFHLLSEEKFALSTAQVGLRLHLDVRFELGKLCFASQDGEQFLGAFLHLCLFEQHDVLIVGDGQAAADEVDEEDAALQVVQCERRLDVHTVATQHELVGQVLAGFGGGMEFAVVLAGQLFGKAFHVSHQVVVAHVCLDQLDAAEALQKGCPAAVGQFQNLHHASEHTGAVEVLLFGVFRVLLLLTHHRDGLFLFFSIAEQFQGRFAVHVHRQQRLRKEHHVAQGQDGYFLLLDAHVGHFHFVAVELGHHLHTFAQGSCQYFFKQFLVHSVLHSTTENVGISRKRPENTACFRFVSVCF